MGALQAGVWSGCGGKKQQRTSASHQVYNRLQVLFVDEDDLKLIEQMRQNGGDLLTIAMRQFAEEYPVAAKVGSSVMSSAALHSAIVAVLLVALGAC
jgi:hypothetical protein